MTKRNRCLLMSASFNLIFCWLCKQQEVCFAAIRLQHITRQGVCAFKATNDCQTNLEAANVKIAGLQDQLQAERQHNASLQSALEKSLTSASQGNVNVSKLVDEINSSNKYIQQLIASKNKSDSLNMILTNNLTRSLSQSEMKDVDVQVLKGVVYISLSDNMLYKSGQL